MHPHTLTHGIHASQQMQCRSELNDKALLNKKKKTHRKIHLVSQEIIENIR